MAAPVVRPCGDCTMCCRILPVPQLRKPAGRTCTHCRVGQGCGIYADRPPVCRTWQCLWSTSPDLPEELRPDRCGVMLFVNGRDGVAVVDPERAVDWRTGMVGQAIAKLARRMPVVWVSHGSERYACGPGGVRGPLHPGLP